MNFSKNIKEAIERVAAIHVNMAVTVDLLDKGQVDPVVAADALDRFGRDLRDLTITICEMTYWMKKEAKNEGVAS